MKKSAFFTIGIIILYILFVFFGIIFLLCFLIGSLTTSLSGDSTIYLFLGFIVSYKKTILLLLLFDISFFVIDFILRKSNHTSIKSNNEKEIKGKEKNNNKEK